MRTAVRGPSYRETFFVLGLLLALTMFLWWCLLPLPHGDLNFYTEPAYMLATTGKLAAHGSQYIDLTYQKGMYFYPPGYFLILAAWLRLFGLSQDSLLAYAHLMHFGFLAGLWVLVRVRYLCSPLASALVLVAAFAPIPHGRPDLTACLLSVAAWLALRLDRSWPWLAISGLLSGATLLVSPALGVTLLPALSLVILLDDSFPLPTRFRSFLLWSFCATSFFAVVVCAVLLQQHSWILAYIQFKTNSAIRGQQLNILRDTNTRFFWVFAIIPYVLAAVLPAVSAVIASWKEKSSLLRLLSLAFLASAACWYAINKAQLLTMYQYLHPAKYVFLGAFASWPRLSPRLRVLPLFVIAIISFYYHKSNFLYLAEHLREHAPPHDYSLQFPPFTEIAVDALYFTDAFRPEHTLSTPLLGLTYWRSYKAAIPPRWRSQLLAGLPETPAQPSLILLSAATAFEYGEPDLTQFDCLRPPDFSTRLKTLGRTWNLPEHPFSLMVCTRTEVPPPPN